MEQLKDEFGETDVDFNSNVISKDYRFWWQQCAFEIGDAKGKPVINKDGTVNEYLCSLPLICSVYGDGDEIAQVSTSYN